MKVAIKSSVANSRATILTPQLASMLVVTLFSLICGAGTVFANFTRVGALPLNAGEDEARCAVIDSAGGFAYFGTFTDPGAIVKVRLSDFSRVGVLTLNAGEYFLNSAVIDPVGGFAYFGTQSSPGTVVKVRLSDFTRVGALNMNVGENHLISAAIDPAGDFAYFGTDNSPGIVVKVRLSNFTRVGALTMNAGENHLGAAAIDPAGGFAYFGAYTTPGTVVKVKLSNFTRVGALVLNAGEDKLISAVIDPAAGFAYFGTETNPGIVAKVRLSDFTRMGALTLNFNEAFLSSGVIDPAGGFAYFGSSSTPGRVTQMRLSDFTRVGSLALNSGENLMESAVIDPAAGFAYFGSHTTPGNVVKIDISTTTPTPSLSISDVTSAEGNSGTKAFNFTVTLSAASAQMVTVNYATADGTAQSGSDYQPVNSVLVFAPGETSKTITVQVNGDTLSEPNEGFFVNLSNPANATILKAQGVGTIVNDDAVAPPTLQFGAANYNVQEDLGALTVTVTRSGDNSGTASVDYATVDSVATQKGDFEYAAGRLTFAPGDTTKSFQVLINEDMYPEGNETFGLSLSSVNGAALGSQSTATVTIADDSPESITNPIDGAQSFVYQHYHDMLNREPDGAGLAFWTNEINSCGADQACLDAKRANVSAAFYLSIEFQNTGYLVYRIYKAAYGNMPGMPVPVHFNEFVRDTHEVGQGVVVNQAGWDQVLENNKQAYLADFVQRQKFTLAYPASMTPMQFVDTLSANAGITPSAGDRQAAINEFAGSPSTLDATARARALRDVAENPVLTQQEFSRAFVLMQYFGYLRRDPDAAPDSDLSGYNFWLNKLNQFNGDYNAAQMVKAFINSGEYRQRFGQ